MYTHTYKHATREDKKGHAFEREYTRIHGMMRRKGREGRNEVIIL